MKTKPKIPEYFEDLPDTANLNSNDLAKIFGYKNGHNISTYSKLGMLPNPDLCFKGKLSTSYKQYYWTVKTIRDWIEKNGD